MQLELSEHNLFVVSFKHLVHFPLFGLSELVQKQLVRGLLLIVFLLQFLNIYLVDCILDGLSHVHFGPNTEIVILLEQIEFIQTLLFTPLDAILEVVLLVDWPLEVVFLVGLVSDVVLFGREYALGLGQIEGCGVLLVVRLHTLRGCLLQLAQFSLVDAHIVSPEVEEHLWISLVNSNLLIIFLDEEIGKALDSDQLSIGVTNGALHHIGLRLFDFVDHVWVASLNLSNGTHAMCGILRSTNVIADIVITSII